MCCSILKLVYYAGTGMSINKLGNFGNVAVVELKKVEVASAQEKLKNTKLFAKQKGIAIVDQKNDWQGRPVAVGEKIMTVANPDEVEFLIWLPVKDSLVIKENSKAPNFKFGAFLHLFLLSKICLFYFVMSMYPDLNIQ